MYGSLQSVE